MSYVQSAQVTNPDGVTDEAAHIVLSGDKKYFILEEIDRLENYVLSFWIKGKTAGKMILNYGCCFPVYGRMDRQHLDLLFRDGVLYV